MPLRNTILFLFLIAMSLPDADAQLRITGRIGKVRLCKGDDRVYALQVPLRLSVKNIGRNPVILSTSHANVLYSKFSVTSTPPGHWDHSFTISSGPKLENLPSRPTGPYRVLKAGQTLTIPADIRLLVLRDDLKKARYLHLVLENSPWTSDPAWTESDTEILQEKWIEYGILWRSTFRPEPIRFAAPAEVDESGCPP